MQLGVRVRQDRVPVGFAVQPGVAQQVDHHRRRVQQHVAQLQAAQCARLLLELRRGAGVDRVVAAVVRPRRDFVDQQRAILEHEELHREHAHVVEAPRQPRGDIDGLVADLQRDARGNDGGVEDAVPVLILGHREAYRCAVVAARQHYRDFARERKQLLQHARNALPCVPLRARSNAVGDARLPLAVVAEARRLEQRRISHRPGRSEIRLVPQQRERADRKAVVAQESLLADAILRHCHHRARRAHHATLAERDQAVRRRILELGGHGRAARHPVERRRVVERRAQVLVGEVPGRRCRVRVEHDHLVAHGARRDREHAAELTATEQAERARRKNHGTAGKVIAATCAARSRR